MPEAPTISPQQFVPTKVSLPQQFVTDLAAQINRHGLEKHTNEPDFVTAEFLTSTLEAYIRAKLSYKNKGG